MSYELSETERNAALQLNAANFGRYPMVNGLTRLQTRFCEDATTIDQLQKLGDSPLRADQALAQAQSLVTNEMTRAGYIK